MKAKKSIYNSYYIAKKDNLYYNEIKELSKLSDSSLSRVLKELTKEKIISKTETKSNTYYKIQDKKIFALEFSKLAYESFLNLNISVKVPLKNFLKNIPKETYTIILFGSASRKEEQKNSDIDLLIITNNKSIDYKENKKEGEITSKYPISIFLASIEEFIKNNDDVIIQARKTGFPICKEQNFYEVIIDGRY